jgi:hypothetical protein
VPPDLRGFALAQRLAEVAGGQSGLEVLLGATAQAWGDEGVLLVETAGEPLLVTTSALVLAAGTRDRKVAFPGGDLPGVMLVRGIQRLLHRDRVRPGLRAVVATDGAGGDAEARELLDAGVEVAALADARVASDLARPSSRAPRRPPTPCGCAARHAVFTITVAAPISGVCTAWRSADRRARDRRQAGDVRVKSAARWPW